MKQSMMSMASMPTLSRRFQCIFGANGLRTLSEWIDGGCYGTNTFHQQKYMIRTPFLVVGVIKASKSKYSPKMHPRGVPNASSGSNDCIRNYSKLSKHIRKQRLSFPLNSSLNLPKPFPCFLIHLILLNLETLEITISFSKNSYPP